MASEDSFTVETKARANAHQDQRAHPRDTQLSRMREFNAELDRLMREQFYSSKTPEEFLIEVTRTASRTLNVQRASIWTYTDNRQAIRCQCLFDKEHQPDASGMVLHQKDFPMYFEAISQSRLVSAEDAQSDPRTSEFTDSYLKPLQIGAMLDAHVPSATGVRGVLCCENVGSSRAWAMDEQSFAASLAELVGLALDRAEKEHTQQQLAIALRAAEKAGEAKASFLANMSHEIRTPMNGILGMLELVLHDETDPSKRDQLEIANNSAKSLLQILDDVLDYSRLEAGELDVVSERYDLTKIVTEVTALFRSKAQAKGILISIGNNDEIPETIVGDQSRVRQVLSNFVSNAIKFTDQGSVDVGICREPNNEGDFLRIEVRDTGIGISDESLSKLFQRFSQVDNSSTRRYGGTGLGLVISKQLVELMGGEIGVESEENAGTCFWISLPMQKEVEVGTADEQPDRISSKDKIEQLRSLKILAAEDNKINQKVLKAMLNSLGHDVTLAETGQKALDALDSNSFDIIFMDIQMPVLDGVSATRAIRNRHTPDRDITIVALTANAMNGDRERYLAAGMNDYLAKPFQREQLVETLERAFPEPADSPGVVSEEN